MEKKVIKWVDIKGEGSGHYKTIGDCEPIDLYRSSGMLRHFALGSIIKYAFRNRDLNKKPSIKDLKKIIHYAEIIIASEFTEKEQV